MFVFLGIIVIFFLDINLKGNLLFFMGNIVNIILFMLYSLVVLCFYFLYIFNIVMLLKFEDINNKI